MIRLIQILLLVIILMSCHASMHGLNENGSVFISKAEAINIVNEFSNSRGVSIDKSKITAVMYDKPDNIYISVLNEISKDYYSSIRGKLIGHRYWAVCEDPKVVNDSMVICGMVFFIDATNGEMLEFAGMLD